MSKFPDRSISYSPRARRKTSSASCGSTIRSGLLSEAPGGNPILIDRRGFLGWAAKGGVALAAASAGLFPVVGHRLDALAAWRTYWCDGCSSYCRWQYASCYFDWEVCSSMPRCDSYRTLCEGRRTGCVVTWSLAKTGSSTACSCQSASCDQCVKPFLAASHN